MGVFGIKDKATSKDVSKDEVRENDAAEIRDTDIVFECPHCGKCLVIDYRGAGLQIECSECHKPVLVPIPDGMELGDLDLDPTELLEKLFAIRRSYQKAAQKIESLKARLLQIQETVGVMQAVVLDGLARSNDAQIKAQKINERNTNVLVDHKSETDCKNSVPDQTCRASATDTRGGDVHVLRKAATEIFKCAREWTDYVIREDYRFGFYRKHEWLRVDKIREYMPVALIESGIFKFTQFLKMSNGETSARNYMADKVCIESRICELDPSARNIIDFVEAHWTSIGNSINLQRWIGAIIERVPQYNDQSLRADIAAKTYVDFATASAILHAAAPSTMINETTWNEVCKYLAPSFQTFYEAFITYQELSIIRHNIMGGDCGSEGRTEYEA